MKKKLYLSTIKLIWVGPCNITLVNPFPHLYAFIYMQLVKI